MTIEIRRQPASEIAAWFAVVMTAFGEDARPDAIEQFGPLFQDRLFAAMDGERIVGTAATITFELTVPGGAAVPAAGVTAVGVLPTDRRRGVLTAMMRAQLDEARAAGEPVAVLWASESVIYQRFGYGLSTLHGTVEVQRHRNAFREVVPADGRIRIVDPEEAKRLLPPLFDRLRLSRAGFFSRSEAWWDAEMFWDPEYRRHGASARRYAVHEVEGEPDGYGIYRVTPAWGDTGPEGKLDVREVMASTPRATKAIWRFLLDHDLMFRLKAGQLPPDPPLLLLLADPRALSLTIGDGLWLRILDLPATLAARTYAGSGTLTMELRDPMYEDLAGRWRLDVTDGRGRAVRTDARPGLALGIDDLAAMYLGQWNASTLALSGRVVEVHEGALATADVLFATSLSPWCPQIF